MKTRLSKWTVMVLATAITSGTAFGQRPDAPGHKGKQKGGNQDDAVSLSVEGGVHAHVYFTDERIRLITDFYSSRRTAGGCPPGLAKKGNGCRPPGLAKKWRIGAPLPDDVVYYDVPDSLVVELGLSSKSQKLVRVGTDLLLIAVGTGMVIDAIEDLDDVF